MLHEIIQMYISIENSTVLKRLNDISSYSYIKKKRKKKKSVTEDY